MAARRTIGRALGVGILAVALIGPTLLVTTPAQAQDPAGQGVADAVPVPSSDPGPSSWDAVATSDGLQAAQLPDSGVGAVQVAPLDGDVTRLQVKYRPGGPDAMAQDAIAAAGGVVEPLFSRPAPELRAERVAAEAVVGRPVPDLTDWVLVSLDDASRGDMLISELAASPSVAVIQPDIDLATTATPDEDLQLYLNAGPLGVDAEWAWGRTAGAGGNVSVGVIDSGFDLSHPDLDRVRTQGLHLPNQPAWDSRHGMHVLGVLVSDDDGVGIRGIVHDAGIVTSNGGTKASHVANAINLVSAALEPGDVISISQGACAESGCANGVVLPLVYSALARDALRVATARGVVTVVSAGNSSIDLGNYVDRLGGDSPDTIVAGAGNPPAMAACVDEDGPARGRVASSNYGTRVDLQGYGACLWTTAPGDSYTFWGFTSGATPIVAGAAASLSSIAEQTRGITLSGDQVRELLVATGSAQVTAGTRGGKIGPLPDIESAVANLSLIPANDMWAAASAIGLPVRAETAARWAGVQVDEPAPLCGSIGHTVWYTLTPTSETTVTFDTIGSDFDTMIGLWRDAGSTLTRVGCNDDRSAGSDQSLLVRTLEAGQTYYIQVGGRGGDDGSLVFNAAIGGRPPGTCDVNGDGLEDIVSGAPLEDIGAVVDAGRALVHYGRVGGAPTEVRAITQESPGISGGSEIGDRFGAAVACGDFDGDGHSDIAIGTPGEGLDGNADVGMVRIVPGAASGLSSSGRRSLSQNTPGVEGSREADDRFGAALATGDFNGDGFDDLAIGVPGEDLGGKIDVGAVQIMYGSASGIEPGNDRFVHQDSFDVWGVNEAFDEFGSVLAAGDVNGDGFDDLVVGAPDEAIGPHDGAGAVWFLPGGVFGVTGADGRSFSQRTDGISGEPEPGDGFGAALAVGDVDADGRAEIVVGVPGEDLRGHADAGIAHVLRGATWPRGTGSKLLHQDIDGVAGTAEPDDSFGAAVSIGDIDGDGAGDVIIGVPGEALGPRAFAGGTHVLYGTPSGVTTSGDTWIHQDQDGVPGVPEPDDRLGAALVARDLDGDGHDDVVIGVPGESLGDIVGAGYVSLVWGSAGGADLDSATGVHQERPRTGASEPNDHFGAVLAG